MLWFFTLLALASAVAVVVFESPQRSSIALLFALSAAGTAIAIKGMMPVAVSLVWILGGGAVVLLLMTTLLMNLHRDEIGRRIYSVRRTIALAVLVYFSSALLSVLFGAAADLPARSAVVFPSEAIGAVLFERHGLTVAVASLALVTSLIMGLVIARRRA